MNKYYKSLAIRVLIGFVPFLLVFISSNLCFAQLPSTNQPVFNHAALCAKDLKKTAAFYRNVLLLQEIKNPFNDTLHVWFKIGEGLALHVIHGECPETSHDIGIHLCFSVPDLNAFINHLDKMQVAYSNWTGQKNKIQLRTDGVKQIYFRDPDGFWIEVNDAK